MVFKKLRNLVVRQAQVAASKETAKNQPSSDNEQLEPISVRRPCSLATAAKVPAVVVTNKGRKRKRQVPFLKVKQMKLLLVLLLTKVVKGDKSGKTKLRNSRQSRPLRINDKLLR